MINKHVSLKLRDTVLTPPFDIPIKRVRLQFCEQINAIVTNASMYNMIQARSHMKSVQRHSDM